MPNAKFFFLILTILTMFGFGSEKFLRFSISIFGFGKNLKVQEVRSLEIFCVLIPSLIILTVCRINKK